MAMVLTGAPRVRRDVELGQRHKTAEALRE